MHGMSELIIDTDGTAKFKLCWKLEILGGQVDGTAISLASSESSLSISLAQLASCGLSKRFRGKPKLLTSINSDLVNLIAQCIPDAKGNLGQT